MTTVLIPNWRQARWILSAISPRLAMSTLSNMGRSMPSLDSEQCLSNFHFLSCLCEDGGNFSGTLGFNRIKHFHGFDHAQYLSLPHAVANLDEGRLTGRRRQMQ